MYDLFPKMSLNQVNSISVLGLAHVGDGVYELLTRTMLCTEGHRAVIDLHRSTVQLVKAQAQAQAMERLLPMLTEDELAIYKRGRNAKVNSAPKNAKLSQYHAATGLEALFGWLYLQGMMERVEELFTAAMEEIHNAT